MKFILLCSLVTLFFSCVNKNSDDPTINPFPSRDYEGPSTQGLVEEPSAPDYGWLQVVGAQLLSEKGDVVQLKGMSSHGMQWYPELINETSLTHLRDEWKSNLVRLAMYTEEGGYVHDPSVKEEVIRAAKTRFFRSLMILTCCFSNSIPNRTPSLCSLADASLNFAS